MRGMLSGSLALLMFLAAGCCTSKKPRALAVDEAMRQVAQGLNAFAAMPLDRRSGLVPADVTVVLNVTESRTDTAEGGVTAAAATAAPKLMVDFSRQTTETHGNQITLKFTNLLLADKTTLAGAKSPDELMALFGALTNAGFVVKMPAPAPAP